MLILTALFCCLFCFKKIEGIICRNTLCENFWKVISIYRWIISLLNVFIYIRSFSGRENYQTKWDGWTICLLQISCIAEKMLHFSTLFYFVNVNFSQVFKKVNRWNWLTPVSDTSRFKKKDQRNKTVINLGLFFRSYNVDLLR